MPLRVEVSSRARTDLERQYAWYLEHADVEVAERYREAVDASVKAVASFPGLGIARNFKSASRGSSFLCGGGSFRRASDILSGR